jgi:signal transduction histidine kinase/CheY-like chemotaxis protein/HPt (histidine-containing phosphotransfer) domain-containing protein
MIAFKSVRQKLFAGVLLTSLVALLVSGVSLFLYDLYTYRETTSNGLALDARLLGYVTSAALQFDDRAVAEQNLAFLKSRPTIRSAAIYGPRGELFATYLRRGVPASEIPARPDIDGISISGDRTDVVHRVRADKEILGTVYISEDLEMYKRVGSYAVIALAVMLAALGVSTALSAWLQRAITRPIIRISDLAREVVEKRDYSLRAQRTTRDEIGVLVEAFNEMLAEIQRRTAALETSSAEVIRLNKDLERRVSERTAELQESNLRLKDANLAKSNFLSMMSHEIRTPMNGVLGMLELLSLGELDRHQRTTLEIVRDSSRSLLRIIDDILDFSKIEAGKLEVRAEVASISILRSRIDPRISPAVVVDPLRLQQILNNLVSNAIKFTSKGSVEIAADLVERKDDADVVRISVTDTGIGIAPEAQAALFQPFVQADGDITRVFGGTGLGLSIGQRLAQLMGGSIAIDSEPGKGTTVSVTLPLPIAEPHLLPTLPGPVQRDAFGETIVARRKAPTLQEAEEEGTLVLAVDDHPINRMLLTRQVTVLGYANEEASDGAEALALWKSGRFRLVITDVNMPEMDGYALARAIRSIEKRAGQERTVIIACTANALKGEAENCFAAGMDDYIAKPVELEALLAKLDNWLPIPGGGARESGGAAEDDAPLIDPAVLAEISGGDPGVEREIFAQFLPVNEEDAAALTQALADNDIAAVVHFAHRIKGASNAIGAAALAKVCGRMEAAARAKDWSTVSANRERFEREAARLNGHLRALA